MSRKQAPRWAAIWRIIPLSVKSGMSWSDLSEKVHAPKPDHMPALIEVLGKLANQRKPIGNHEDQGWFAIGVRRNAETQTAIGH